MSIIRARWSWGALPSWMAVTISSPPFASQPRPVSELQPLTPEALEHVILKRLAKDPNERWQSAADVAHELQWIGQLRADVPKPGRSLQTVALASALLLGLLLGALAMWRFRPPAKPSPVVRFSIPLPPKTTTYGFATRGMAISPDGSRIVFSLLGERTTQLWLRSMESNALTPLPDTTGAIYPFWSPNGDFIAFFADGKLKKLPASGGSPQIICDAPSGRGGTWGPDGTILFAPKYWLSPIAKVSAAGGTPSPVTTFDASHEYTHRFPLFLPDGRHFLYVSRVKPGANGFARGQIIAASLDKPSERQVLVDNASNPAYVEPGWLLFVRESSLMAVRFDAEKIRLAGEPIALPIGKIGIYQNRNYGYYAASNEGTLVFLPPNTSVNGLRWFDMKGNAVAAEEQPGYYWEAALSHDRKRVVFVRSEDGVREHCDIWLHDVGSANSTRFTYDGGYVAARLSADGKRLYYNSEKKGVSDLYRRSVAGSSEEEALYVSPQWKDTFDVAPDETQIVFDEQFPETQEDLLLQSLTDRRTSIFLRTPGNDFEPSFSPDGKWLAFVSDAHVAVRRIPDSGEQWQLSPIPGRTPVWTADGKKIFYQSTDGAIMSVPVRTAGSFEPGTAERLFSADRTAMPDTVSGQLVGVSGDGQRLLIFTKAEEKAASPFEVVLNWPAMLPSK